MAERTVATGHFSAITQKSGGPYNYSRHSNRGKESSHVTNRSLFGERNLSYVAFRNEVRSTIFVLVPNHRSLGLTINLNTMLG